MHRTSIILAPRKNTANDLARVLVISARQATAV
jgi:hypothetical protein